MQRMKYKSSEEKVSSGMLFSISVHNFSIKASVVLVHKQAASVFYDKFKNRVVNIFSLMLREPGPLFGRALPPPSGPLDFASWHL